MSDEINKNYAQIERMYIKCGDDRFDIVSLQLWYNVGQLPNVRVTVSGGADEIGNQVNNSDKISEANGLCHVVLKLCTKHGVKDFTFFSGYIQAKTPELNATPGGIGYRTTLLLVAEPGLLSMSVPGGYTYLHAGNNNTLEKSPLATIAAAFTKNSREQTEAMKLFNQSPSKCIASFITSCMDRLGDQQQAVSLLNSIIHANGVPARQIESGCSYGVTLLTGIINGLQSTPPLQVFLSFCKLFFLDTVPETLAPEQRGTTAIANRLIARPVCGWDKQSVYTIQTKDVLSLSGMTTYQLGKAIDCWGVCFSQAAGNVVNGLVAVYGPRYTKSVGTPEVFTERELATKVPKIQDAKQRFSAVQVTNLPAWLVMMPKVSTTAVKDPNNKTGAAAVSVEVEDKTTYQQNELWAKRLAVLSFLQNGRNSIGMSISVPFIVLCRLMPYIGDTICVENPNPTDTLNKATKKTSYYGLLTGLSLSIQLSGTDIATTAQATITHVHTQEEHDKFAADNPFYTMTDKDKQEAQKGAFALAAHCS